MSATKLSPPQLKVLRELCAPGNCAHFIDGRNDYWFVASTMKRQTREVDALIKKGLLEKTGGLGKVRARPAPAARELVAALDSEVSK